jgi:hypothetical protein
VKLNKIGKYSSILTNDFPTRRRTTTTKQNLDPRCTYVPTRVKKIHGLPSKLLQLFYFMKE